MKHADLIQNLVNSVLVTGIIMGIILSIRYYKIHKYNCTNKITLFIKSCRFFFLSLLIAGIAGIIFYIGLTLFVWWLLLLAAIIVFL